MPTHVNPLSRPSGLPYGIQDFARITDADFAEAMQTGMDEELAELDAVATTADAATVDSVLDAWERSGTLLARAGAAFWCLKSADTNDERDAIEEVFSPKYAAHYDAIMLDRRLFDRLLALQGRADAGEVTLDEQESWLLSERLREFRRQGVDLSPADQERLKALNAEIATLEARFGQTVVAGRNAAAVHITDESELDGLSEADIEHARDSAERRGWDGWALDLVNTTGQPILASLTNRAVRRRLYEASVSRGLGGEFDTRPIVVALVRARTERANLLGFPHHAAFIADDGCAKTTDTVNEILTRVAPPAIANATREAGVLQERLTAIDPEATLEPWDWQFLEERERASRFSLDENELRPYLEFERVLTRGVFAAATSLYGITFHPRPDVVGYTDECRTYEVKDEDGTPLALVVIDPYSRPTKQGGAWMNSLVDQSHLRDELAIVTCNCNQNRPSPGNPSLMSWDNVITLFHEFGHDLHGLLSDVRYPSVSGTSTPRDFVEFPSQVNEMWAWDPSLIEQYAVHHLTGEPMPRAWIDTLLAARHFGEGYAAVESFSAMILDQVWHQTPLADLPTSPDEVEAFEAQALASRGVAFELVPPRYRTGYFSHVWGGGYSAGYYSYLWAEVMDADTVAWFGERGGLNRDSGEIFRRRLLARGGSVDVMASYRDFRGADPDITHLLERRGLV